MLFQQPEQKSSSDDDFRSGCQNVSHHYRQQSFSGLHSSRQSNYTVTNNKTIFYVYLCGVYLNNYSSLLFKVVDIYFTPLWLDKYPPLFTSTLVSNCLLVVQSVSWMKNVSNVFLKTLTQFYPICTV